MRSYDKHTLSILVRKNIRKYRKMRNYTLQELADKTDLPIITYGISSVLR